MSSWKILKEAHSIDPFCSSGVFISSADNTLILATAGTISSELGNLENQSWLVVSYSFAICAVQPAVCNLLSRQMYIQFSFLILNLKIDRFGLNHLVWKTERYIRPKSRADRRLCIICHRHSLIVSYDTFGS